MRRAQKGDKRAAVKLYETGRWFVTQQEYNGREYKNCRKPEPCYRDGLIEVIERLQS